MVILSTFSTVLAPLLLVPLVLVLLVLLRTRLQIREMQMPL